MGAESVRHRFDEGRPVAFPGATGRVAGGPEDRERVHPVDADSVETVCGRFLRQGRRGRLLRDGDGDRPLVVVAEEDGRRSEDAREVHRGVEVRRARRPVTEEDEDRMRLAAELHRPGDADRVRDLRPDRRADRKVVSLPVDVMAGPLPVQPGVCRAVVTDYTEGIDHAVPRTPKGPERQNYRGGLKPSYPGISKRFAPLSAW